MAKRITSGKREREKLKQTKRQDKQKKKEERLRGGSRSFEDMLAYVDENGVLHTTPQDVKPKEEIDASQIEISVPRQSEIEEEEPMSGRVEYFTASKGYGFIKDAAGSEKYFFHIYIMLCFSIPKDSVFGNGLIECSGNLKGKMDLFDKGQVRENKDRI